MEIEEDDVRAILDHHLTSDMADRILSDVSMNDIDNEIRSTGLLHEDRTVFRGCCLYFLEEKHQEPSTSSNMEPMPEGLLNGVADVAMRKKHLGRWRYWWKWEKMKLQVTAA